MASDSAPEEEGSTLDYVFESVTFGLFSPTKAAEEPDAFASRADDAAGGGFMSHMWSTPEGASGGSGEGGDNATNATSTPASSTQRSASPQPSEMHQETVDAHMAAVLKVAHTDVQRRGSVNTGGFLFFDTETVTLMCTVMVQSHARGMFARKRVQRMRERAARAALIAAEEEEERKEKRAQLKRLKEVAGENAVAMEVASAEAPSSPPSPPPGRVETVATPPKSESARLINSMQSAPANLDASGVSERSAVATPRSAPSVSENKIYVGGMVQTREVKLQQANLSAAARRANSYTKSHVTIRSPGPKTDHLFMGGIKSDSSIHFRSRAASRKSRSIGPRCRAVSRDEDGVMSTPRISPPSRKGSFGDEDYYSDSDDDGGFTIVLDDDPVRANAPDSTTRSRGKSTEKQFQRFVASPQSVRTPRSRESSFASQASQASQNELSIERTSSIEGPLGPPYDPASPRNMMPVRRMSLTPVKWAEEAPVSPLPPGNATASRLNFGISPVDAPR